MQPVLISTAEAAELLGVSVATINRWVADAKGPLHPYHELPGRTGARLFARRDVEKLAAKRSKGAA